MSYEAMISAGAVFSYCVETVSGTRPSTSYIKIPEIKSVPSFNPQPEAIETTPLEETEYKTYTEGLKDLGGAIGFKANLTSNLITIWGSCVSAHDTGLNSNLATWFCVSHPKLTNAVFFQGDPAALGLDEMSVGSVLETTLYVTPNSAPQWASKPSFAS